MRARKGREGKTETKKSRLFPSSQTDRRGEGEEGLLGVVSLLALVVGMKKSRLRTKVPKVHSEV